jgi:serine/threonine protein kinase
VVSDPAPPSPLCSTLSTLLNPLHSAPPSPPTLSSQRNARTGRVRYRSTTGLVLERLPITLEQHVRALGADLYRLQILQLAVQVLDSLVHLHKNGVVHGDIKLNNFMVAVVATGGDDDGGGGAGDGPSEGDENDDQNNEDDHDDGDAREETPTGTGGGGTGAGAGGDRKPRARLTRVVLVDFGCAVLRGTGTADMDEHFQVHAAEATYVLCLRVRVRVCVGSRVCLCFCVVGSCKARKYQPVAKQPVTFFTMDVVRHLRESG